MTASNLQSQLETKRKTKQSMDKNRRRTARSSENVNPLLFLVALPLASAHKSMSKKPKRRN